MTTHDRVRVGLVSISDRASGGVYADQGLPALRTWFEAVLANPDVRRVYLGESFRL